MVTRCDRFEREGLLQLEEGAGLDEHFSTCPDCLAERAVYEELGRRMGSEALGEVPPAGWQARVRAAIARRRSRRRWVWTMVPAALAASMAVLLLTPSATRSPLALEVGVAPGDLPLRGGAEAQPGSRLTLRATTGGARYAELRVYFNDGEVALRCSSEPPCRRGGEVIEASLVLSSIGSYLPLLLVSDAPLPAPSSGADQDAGAAIAAGGRVEVGREIRVR